MVDTYQNINSTCLTNIQYPEILKDQMVRNLSGLVIISIMGEGLAFLSRPPLSIILELVPNLTHQFP